MKRLYGLTLAALLGTAATSWAGFFCCLPSHCICPPPPPCRDCGCPCDHGFHPCSEHKIQHAHELICQLQGSCECCERIKIVHKLGSRLHADFCCDPEVLHAVIGVLLSDTCWEVREAAAWSIALQRAYTPEAVLALYISSKVDPHYMVRDRAIMALDVLLVCRRECFETLFKYGDAVVKELRRVNWKPTGGESRVVFNVAASGCGAMPMQTAPVTPNVPSKPVETIPPPKTSTMLEVGQPAMRLW